MIEKYETALSGVLKINKEKQLRVNTLENQLDLVLNEKGNILAENETLKNALSRVQSDNKCLNEHIGLLQRNVYEITHQHTQEYAALQQAHRSLQMKYDELLDTHEYMKAKFSQKSSKETVCPCHNCDKGHEVMNALIEILRCHEEGVNEGEIVTVKENIMESFPLTANIDIIRHKLLNLPKDGQAFEHISCSLFRRMGYKVTHRGMAGDDGIDFELRSPNKSQSLWKAVGQCKNYPTRKISSMDIREFLGAMWPAKVHCGYYLTTSSFTSNARQTAASLKEQSVIVELWDLDVICQAMEPYAEDLLAELDRFISGEKCPTTPFATPTSHRQLQDGRNSKYLQCMTHTRSAVATSDIGLRDISIDLGECSPVYSPYTDKDLADTNVLSLLQRLSLSDTCGESAMHSKQCTLKRDLHDCQVFDLCDSDEDSPDVELLHTSLGCDGTGEGIDGSIYMSGESTARVSWETTEDISRWSNSHAKSNEAFCDPTADPRPVDTLDEAGSPADARERMVSSDEAVANCSGHENEQCTGNAGEHVIHDGNRIEPVQDVSESGCKGYAGCVHEDSCLSCTFEETGECVVPADFNSKNVDKMMGADINEVDVSVVCVQLEINKDDAVEVRPLTPQSFIAGDLVGAMQECDAKNADQCSSAVHDPLNQERPAIIPKPVSSTPSPVHKVENALSLSSFLRPPLTLGNTCVNKENEVRSIQTGSGNSCDTDTVQIGTEKQPRTPACSSESSDPYPVVLSRNSSSPLVIRWPVLRDGNDDVFVSAASECASPSVSGGSGSEWSLEEVQYLLSMVDKFRESGKSRRISWYNMEKWLEENAQNEGTELYEICPIKPNHFSKEKLRSKWKNDLCKLYDRVL